MSKEKRAPLLSDEDMYSIVGVTAVGEWSVRPLKSPFDIRDFYEKKITSGELMVVKSVTYGDGAGLARNCSGCSHLSTLNESKYFNFCPGCGAKIIKP